jgi:hypothetical protein
MSSTVEVVNGQLVIPDDDAPTTPMILRARAGVLQGSADSGTTWGAPSAAASASAAGSMSAADFMKLAGGNSPGYVPFYYSAIIDCFASPATYQIIPAGVPFRMRLIQPFWEIKTRAVTISTSPTFAAGANATFDDYVASQTQAGFTSQAAETTISPTQASPNPTTDLTTNGFAVKIITAATGTGSPALTARFCIGAVLIPI